MRKLTAPDGHPVWVNLEHAHSIHQVRPNEGAPLGANTKIVFGDTFQYVKEGAETVAAWIPCG